MVKKLICDKQQGHSTTWNLKTPGDSAVQISWGRPFRHLDAKIWKSLEAVIFSKCFMVVMVDLEPVPGTLDTRHGQDGNISHSLSTDYFIFMYYFLHNLFVPTYLYNFLQAFCRFPELILWFLKWSPIHFCIQLVPFACVLPFQYFWNNNNNFFPQIAWSLIIVFNNVFLVLFIR